MASHRLLSPTSPASRSGPRRGLLTALASTLTALLAVSGLTLGATPAQASSSGAASSIAASSIAMAPSVSVPPALVGAVPAARPWPGHPDRHIVRYRVRPGDTAAVIATRFHAWTAELRRLNHKGKHAVWYVGERVRVPVVTSRARAATAARAARPAPAAAPAAVAPPKRTQVRRAVLRAAKRHGVPPTFALAVAWHESGWQQQVRSPAGALGVMQVMPGNRLWLSLIAGQQLRLKDLEDNVTAGVVLLKLLRNSHPGHPRRALAAYYQGDGSIAAHGVYDSTKRYVATVRALQARLAAGWRPDR